MKKILFGTTALVAAGLLAAPAADAKPELSIGGYMEQWIGYSDMDDDTADYMGFDVKSDSEINFKTKAVLDNGFTISTVVEFETDTASDATNDHIDESYVQIDHATFGQLRLGSDKLAAAIVAHGAPSVGPGFGDAQAWISRPANYNAIGDGDGDWSIIDFANDEAGVHYYTPRVFGLGAAVSYVPSGSDQTNNQNSGDANSYSSISLVFNNEFSGVSIDADASMIDSDVGEDVQAYRVGLNVGFAGFTIGGGFANYDNGDVDGEDDGNAYDIGVSYKTGPYGVSLTYGYEENAETAATAGDDEGSVLALSGSYKMGDGVSLQGSIFTADWDEESTAATADQEGWGIVTGIKVSF